MNFLSIVFCKLRFQISRLQMPLEPIVYDTKFRLGGMTIADYYERYVITRELRGYRLWHVSFVILKPLRVRKVGFFRYKLAAVLAARTGNSYGIWAVESLFPSNQFIPTPGRFELELRVEAVAKADRLDDFEKLECAWPGWMVYTTKHGRRYLDIEHPDKCQFEVCNDGDGFAKAVALPYPVFYNLNDYLSRLSVIHQGKQVERLQSIMAQNIFRMADEAKWLFDQFPHPLVGRKFGRCVDWTLDEAGLSTLDALEHQEQVFAAESRDSETDEESENSPVVALDEQQEIVLFGSAKAASEIAWMLRGDWDGSTGVAFAETDGAAIKTATKLLETEFCEVGDYCYLSQECQYEPESDNVGADVSSDSIIPGLDELWANVLDESIISELNSYLIQDLFEDK